MVIVWSEESQAPQKCTLCAHLLDIGWAKPRCAQACGPGALSFVWETDHEFEKRGQQEGIDTLHPGSPERTSVGYKNLARFDSCFIAGSVAVERDGVVDCASGRPAALKRFAAGDEEVLQTVLTDAFGDFKFDGLQGGSGEYVIEVASNGHGPARLAVTLGQSVNLGDDSSVGGER